MLFYYIVILNWYHVFHYNELINILYFKWYINSQFGQILYLPYNIVLSH